jgi:hypothetical protein
MDELEKKSKLEEHLLNVDALLDTYILTRIVSFSIYLELALRLFFDNLSLLQIPLGEILATLLKQNPATILFTIAGYWLISYIGTRLRLEADIFLSRFKFLTHEDDETHRELRDCLSLVPYPVAEMLAREKGDADLLKKYRSQSKGYRRYLDTKNQVAVLSLVLLTNYLIWFLGWRAGMNLICVYPILQLAAIIITGLLAAYPTSTYGNDIYIASDFTPEEVEDAKERWINRRRYLYLKKKSNKTLLDD